MATSFPFAPRPIAATAAVALTVVLTACGGGGNNANNNAGTNTTSAAPATAGGGALPTPNPGPPPAGATTAMVAEGDSIFHGLKAGGLCQTCHMPEATGGPLAPNLTDTQWLTGDGSYEFIQKRVTEGMPNPTPPYPGPMLPMGGAQLTPDQIKAVSAYVYSISHTS